METKEYDLIVVGTGSAINIVYRMIVDNSDAKIAVIDKNDPGGISLTRGCIPSKMLLQHANLARMIEKVGEYNIDIEVKGVDFEKIMKGTRETIRERSESIGRVLIDSENVDYYPCTAEFVDPHIITVSRQRALRGSEREDAPEDMNITSKTIILGLGSRPRIPHIKGIRFAHYYTSDNILEMEKLPDTIAIVGGGYVAAEFGHFFSAMGSRVTVFSRNSRFLPSEEPEISALAEKELGKRTTILTNHEVREIKEDSAKTLMVIERGTGKRKEFTADEVLIATGRAPNTTFIHPVRGGIQTDDGGWVVVDKHLETSQPNIWALGDATGGHMFKHVADYESHIVYHNAILGERIKADYQAIPRAIFIQPEIASVGLGEGGALERYGEDEVLIGFYNYRDTAMGEAMHIENGFVKVILHRSTRKILGAHIIGPQASVLLQEVVTLMYTPDGNADPIIHGMHIHPALSEVVEKAFLSLMTPRQYRALGHNHDSQD